MRIGELGKIFSDGETIIRQGDIGDCMYVLLAGTAKVFVSGPHGDIWLRDLGPGDVFGELAIFSRAPRSATIQASGETRVLTLNKRQFLSRVHEDPTLAFRILEQMANRMESLTDEVVRLHSLVVSAGSPYGVPYSAQVVAQWG